MRDLAGGVATVHRLAETSHGFVWRLATEHGHGLCVVTEDAGPALLNLSVWQDYESLHQFVYRSEHARLLRHRSRWFEPTRQPSTALWWVPDDTVPTVQEATRRLWYLRTYGPTPRSFSLRRRFTADGAAAGRSPARRARPGPGGPRGRSAAAGRERTGW